MDASTNIIDEIPSVLKAVLSSPPSKSDTALTPAWVGVLGNAMLAYHAANAEACAAELESVWKTCWSFLESTHPATRKAASESLNLLTQCFTPLLINPAIQQDNATPIITNIISQTTKALDSIAFARSMPELLFVISSLIANLRYKVNNRKKNKANVATEALFLPLIQTVGNLRTQKGFEHKEAADSTLATAMRVLGPEVLLSALPLNLEPSDR